MTRRAVFPVAPYADCPNLTLADVEPDARSVTPRQTRDALGDYAYSVVIRRGMMGPLKEVRRIPPQL